MASKHPDSLRPRFYRNLQSLKKRTSLDFFGLKHGASSLVISIPVSDADGYENGDGDSQSRLSHQDIIVDTIVQTAPQPNPTPCMTSASSTTEQHSSFTFTHTNSHTRNATFDTIPPSTRSPSQQQEMQSRARPSSTSTSTSFTTSPIPHQQQQTTTNPALPLQTLATHIQTQTIQAQHLLAQIQAQSQSQSHHLSISNADIQWATSTITDTEIATRDVLRLTEPFRVDQAVRNGRVGVVSQVRWLVRDEKRARLARERLVLCHGSLMVVLGWLQGVTVQGAGRGSVGGGGGVGAGLDDGVQVQAGVNRDELEIESKIGNGAGVGASTSISTGYDLPAGLSNLETGTKEMSDSDSGCQSKTNKGRSNPSNPQQRSDDPVWDLAIQLQDAGMEVVTPESDSTSKSGSASGSKSKSETATETATETRAETLSTDALDIIKTTQSTPAQEQDVASPETKLDDELLDMLSWRWNQGRG